MSPKVSIVVPSYNHAAYVIDALESAARQDYVNLEIVVVDDGSSDNSVALIHDYSKRCDREIILLTQENSGAHDAINRGIEVSSGEFIAVLNSDDLYSERRISRLVAASERQELFFGFTGLAYIDRLGADIPGDSYLYAWHEMMVSESEHLPGLGFAFMLGNFPVSTSNFFFSRTLLDKVGAFKNFRMAHDLDFALRSCYFVEPSFINEKILSYRVHDRNTVSQDPDLVVAEAAQVVGEYLERALSHPPSNIKAPGSERLLFYLKYFLEKRNAWIFPRTLETLTGRTVPDERLDWSAVSDAVALSIECDRLIAKEAERVDAAERRLARLERSLSWRLTSPLRHIKSLLAGTRRNRP